MCQFNNITEFNTYLSDNLKNIKLNEYFNLIHSQFYSKIDISFMDYFLELTNHENEFIVDWTSPETVYTSKFVVTKSAATESILEFKKVPVETTKPLKLVCVD